MAKKKRHQLNTESNQYEYLSVQTDQRREQFAPCKYVTLYPTRSIFSRSALLIPFYRTKDSQSSLRKAPTQSMLPYMPLFSDILYIDTLFAHEIGKLEHSALQL